MPLAAIVSVYLAELLESLQYELELKLNLETIH